MERLKIIFLDIDGVLNHTLFYINMEKLEKSGVEIDITKYGNIDKEQIRLLNELCDETGAKVVISSTWRLDGLEENRAGFKSIGATFDIIDITGHCCSGIRGAEIHNWLFHAKQPIDNYAILDDDNDMLLNQATHFFQVSGYAGLTENHCYRIKNLFNGKESY